MKAARASGAGLTAGTSPKTANAAATRSGKASGSRPSITIRNTPSAARRRPNGSFSPVGSLPMPNIPASASSLSASETACATGPVGSASPAKRGQ